MAKKSSTLLWVGLAGIGALVAYEWWKNKNATTATTTTTTSTTMIESSDASTADAPAGIDPTMYAAVQQWANADGRTPVLAMAAANNPTEYAGMYDLITNWWAKGISVPYGSQQQIFWDALRTKYDPTHQSW